jgi:hypothetical protein
MAMMPNNPTPDQFFDCTEEDERQDWLSFIVATNYPRLAGIVDLINDDRWYEHPNYSQARKNVKSHLERVLMRLTDEQLMSILENFAATLKGAEKNARIGDIAVCLELMNQHPEWPRLNRTLLVFAGREADHANAISVATEKERQASISIEREAVRQKLQFSTPDGDPRKGYGVDNGSDAVRRSMDLLKKPIDPDYPL